MERIYTIEYYDKPIVFIGFHDSKYYLVIWLGEIYHQKQITGDKWLAAELTTSSANIDLRSIFLESNVFLLIEKDREEDAFLPVSVEDYMEELPYPNDLVYIDWDEAKKIKHQLSSKKESWCFQCSAQ